MVKSEEMAEDKQMSGCLGFNLIMLSQLEYRNRRESEERIWKETVDVTWKYCPGILGTAGDTTINRNHDSLLTSQRLRMKCTIVKEEDEKTEKAVTSTKVGKWGARMNEVKTEVS